MKVNYHTHSNYSDGKAGIEDFIIEAINQKYDTLGISCHAPTLLEAPWQIKKNDFENYLKDLDSLSEKYSEKIEILKGLEVDYIKGISGPSNFLSTKLDYIIGSIHYVYNQQNGLYFTIDASVTEFEKGIQLFDNNIKELVHSYFSSVRDMLVYEPPDIIGHLDLIKKFNAGNRFFNETDNWYIDEVKQTIDIIEQTSCIVEINTRGFYKKLTEEVYPSLEILKELKTRKIPVMINTDAHHPIELNLGVNAAKIFIKTAGFESLRILQHGKWQDVEINEFH